ncbi:MAG: hypothetical protein MUP98_04165 [Candidatus Aminicenantes bacterium]|nr:hypothetical protein [Candidatus Aminicenantes bacterium]
MADHKSKKDRIWTGAVIIISMMGILFFGYKAIQKNSVRYQKNPFEYNIDRYKENDVRLVHYSEVDRIPLELAYVYGLAVGPEENIYVSGDKTILIFSGEGIQISSIPVTGTVHCLAVENNGDVYAGMNDHVEVYSADGTKKSEWESPAEESLFTSIALSKDFVFVADAGNLIVWKFDKSGNLLQRIGDRDEDKDVPGFIIPSPYFDVAVDPDGFLWAANTGRHSLENYTLDGGFRTSWGEPSMDIEGFSGCCNPSHFIILEDGSLVTSEKGIARIKVHNQLGEMVSVVAGSDQFVEGTVGLDLAVDSAQRILVLDPKQKLVRIFTKNKKGQ